LVGSADGLAKGFGLAGIVIVGLTDDPRLAEAGGVENGDGGFEARARVLVKVEIEHRRRLVMTKQAVAIHIAEELQAARLRNDGEAQGVTSSVGGGVLFPEAPAVLERDGLARIRAGLVREIDEIGNAGSGNQRPKIANQRPILFVEVRLKGGPAQRLVVALREKTNDDLGEADATNLGQQVRKILAALRSKIAGFGFQIGAAAEGAAVKDRNAQASLAMSIHVAELLIDHGLGRVVVGDDTVRTMLAFGIDLVPRVIGAAAILSGYSLGQYETDSKSAHTRVGRWRPAQVAGGFWGKSADRLPEWTDGKDDWIGKGQRAEKAALAH